ncbi:MAG: prepilin peptidase [Candidatus Pacebacteria bacterium]|nr:prepilin peptidase [Candidatus Paceibacterota bacterium]
MTPLSLLISFIFGAIVGSFLNVVSLRFNTGVGLGGRSKCMSCGEGLTWKELVPVFSFLIQRGACKKCKSKISWQYPLVEFMAGVIFVLIFLTFPPFDALVAVVTLIHVIAACLLLVICVYDIKHKIIPDSFSYAFSAAALLSLFVGGSSWWHIPGYWALIAGPLAATPFAVLWLISRGKWMGLGDAKLMLGIGWFLGVSGAINAMILAFWIAAAASLVWLFVTYKKFKPRTEVPFGPYLILGMYLVLLFQIQVLDINLLKEIIFQ